MEIFISQLSSSLPSVCSRNLSGTDEKFLEFEGKERIQNIVSVGKKRDFVSLVNYILSLRANCVLRCARLCAGAVEKVYTRKSQLQSFPLARSLPSLLVIHSFISVIIPRHVYRYNRASVMLWRRESVMPLYLLIHSRTTLCQTREFSGFRTHCRRVSFKVMK